MTASICLCTYNGGLFLKELLDSLAAQTLRPAELLVGDDGSSDNTLQILRDFAADAPFPMEILTNERRLGPASNLERLLVRATGDVLFPCDQDDIWAPKKIEVLTQALDESPRQGAAICNSSFIDDAGRPLPGSLFERVHLNESTRQLVVSGSGSAMVRIARSNVVANHALVVRRNALDLLLPFGPRSYADWWIAIVLSATTGITIVDDCLVAYRLHDSNTIGMLDRLSSAKRVSPEAAVGFRADMLHDAIARVSELRPGALTSADRVVLEELTAHLRIRGLLPARRARRVIPVLREAIGGRYNRFSEGWRSAVIDVVRQNSPGHRKAG
jgi:glycosyltransferase involved in cell wall biosynthesis